VRLNINGKKKSTFNSDNAIGNSEYNKTHAVTCVDVHMRVITLVLNVVTTASFPIM